MGFIAKFFTKKAGNQFHKDLEKAQSFPRHFQYSLASKLVIQQSRAKSVIEKLPPELVADFLYEQANKSKYDRQQALSAGAKDESDFSWFCAALMESYYNALRVANSHEVYGLVAKMDKWLTCAIGFIDEDVNILLSRQPQCSAYLIVACERYNKNYRCTIMRSVSDVIEMIENIKLNDKAIVGYRHRVIEKAFYAWLNDADLNEVRPSYIPDELYPEDLRSALHDLAKHSGEDIFCPECKNLIDGIHCENRSVSSNALQSSLVEEWTCPVGHILYSEQSDVLWTRKTGSKTTPYIRTVAQILEDSEIFAILEGGNCTGLAVELIYEEDADYFKKNSGDVSVLTELVNVVERRIKEGNVNDYTSDDGKLDSSVSSRGFGNVPRLLISPSKVVVLNWSPNS